LQKNVDNTVLAGKKKVLLGGGKRETDGRTDGQNIGTWHPPVHLSLSWFAYRYFHQISTNEHSDPIRTPALPCVYTFF